MFKTLYCMARSFWETACQPNPGWFSPHSLPWMWQGSRCQRLTHGLNVIAESGNQ